MDYSGAIIMLDNFMYIYFKLTPSAYVWQPVDGLLKYIDMINGMVIGIDTSNHVCYKDTIYDTWYYVAGGISLNNVSIKEDGSLAGVDASNNVWYKEGITKGFWINTHTGSFKIMDCKDNTCYGSYNYA
jgi:hypothetical protein